MSDRVPKYGSHGDSDPLIGHKADPRGKAYASSNRGASDWPPGEDEYYAEAIAEDAHAIPNREAEMNESAWLATNLDSEPVCRCPSGRHTCGLPNEDDE